jgi:hypothetical protein
MNCVGVSFLVLAHVRLNGTSRECSNQERILTLLSSKHMLIAKHEQPGGSDEEAI